MIFTPNSNPTTGETEWIFQEDNQDFHQDIARSGFADMLHDNERNNKYSEALRTSINFYHEQGLEANVIDIGTGTGLLAMMAVKHGADSVIACEAFRPMANCARRIIEKNGFNNKIKLISKCSRNLLVGPGQDMEKKANILVTEIFDTELIGEGALSTFRHALSFLLEPSSVVIPSIAKVYVQIIHSDFLETYNRPRPWRIKDIEISHPQIIENCSGVSHVHDVQLSQLPRNQFQILTDPIEVFQFDFTDLSTLKYDDCSIIELSSYRDSGKANILFMWWDLVMEKHTEDVLSCAPSWEHVNGQQQPWRDHWMQGIYYLSTSISINKDSNIILESHHDEYNYWFRLSSNELIDSTLMDKPQCSCLSHIIYPRNRFLLLSDKGYYSHYSKVLEKLIHQDTVCLILGEGSLLPIIVSKLGAKHVYCFEKNQHSSKILSAYCEVNRVMNVTIMNELLDMKTDMPRGSLVIGEPYFFSSILPWNNLKFWYLKESAMNFLSKNHVVLPYKAYLKAIAVDFKHLWKIRAPVGEIEGCIMDEFDHLIANSIEVSDPPIESHLLWEYETYPKSDSIKIASFDLLKSTPESNYLYHESVPLINEGCVNGVVLWMEWKLSEFSDDIIKTGPLVTPCYGVPITWATQFKQAVYLFKKPHNITDNSSLKISFSFLNGDLKLRFDIHSCAVK